MTENITKLEAMVRFATCIGYTGLAENAIKEALDNGQIDEAEYLRLNSIIHPR